MLSSQGCPRLVQSFVFPRTKVTKRHWIGRVTWMSLIYLWATSSKKIINGNMALCTSSFCTPFLIKLKNAIGFGSLKTKHFRFNPGSLRKYAKSVKCPPIISKSTIGCYLGLSMLMVTLLWRSSKNLETNNLY